MKQPWQILHRDARTALCMHGMRIAIQFCKLNEIPLPVFMTYEEALVFNAGVETKPLRFLRIVTKGNPALVGAGTGLYKDGHIFVNVPVTAAPAAVPGNRRYSWPGWHVDRTAAGVVAHECGHHVEAFYLEIKPKPYIQRIGEQWRQLIQHSGKKKVSGYEPKPSEAFAETLRLFILNPDLLMRAIPARYYWLVEELDLAPLHHLLKQGWRKTLNNTAYNVLAERWITA